MDILLQVIKQSKPEKVQSLKKYNNIQSYFIIILYFI